MSTRTGGERDPEPGGAEPSRAEPGRAEWDERTGVVSFVAGYTGAVTVVIIILLLLALIFGVGAVLEGLAWLFLITLVLLIAAGWFVWRKVRSLGSR